MANDISLEKALLKLEKIVGSLESGDIDLEESLKKYEEGIKLSRLCRRKLTDAEKKIEILTRGTDGELAAESFDVDDQEEGASAPAETGKKVKKNDPPKGRSGEEDNGELFL